MCNLSKFCHPIWFIVLECEKLSFTLLTNSSLNTSYFISMCKEIQDAKILDKNTFFIGTAMGHLKIKLFLMSETTKSKC